MRRTQKPKQPKARISALSARLGLVLLILTVLLGGVIIYFVLGTTTITIAREAIPVEANVTIRLIQAEESAADEAEFSEIPGIAAVLATETVTITDTFTPADEPQQSEQQATGSVTLYNNWSQEQPLAATTRLLSESGVLFRIPERVDVPAGGSVTTPIVADEPGAGGEIGPSRFTLPGLWQGLQDKIYAISTEPTTGGVVGVTVLTEDDIRTAENTLKERAEEATRGAMLALEIPQKGFTLAEHSIQHAITKTERDAEPGEQVESFTMSQTEEVTGVFLDMDTLQTIMRQKLSENLTSAIAPRDQYALTDEMVTVTFTFPDETITLPYEMTVVIAGNAMLTEDAEALKANQIVSYSRPRIEEYFADVEGVASVDVRFSPFWVTRAPANPNQITVKVQ